MSFRHTPSFSPSLFVVTNLAHVLDGEDGIPVRDGCLHAAVAFLPALPNIAGVISVNLSQETDGRSQESRDT